MKKLITILLISVSFIINTYAQSPNKFNYQAALRDASGSILANQSANLEIEIKEGSATGTVVFNETHAVTTNAQGVVNIVIGDTNDLSNVDFSNGSTYFITTKLNGTEMGTTQMLSVPYALNSNGLTLTAPDGKTYKASVTNTGKVVFHMADDETTASQKITERLQEILDNLQYTKYVFSDEALMDEARGIYQFDCSGFVSEFVIKDVLPNHYDDLYNQIPTYHPADTRPRAWTYYDYFRTILGPNYNADIPSTCSNQNDKWKVFTSIDSVQKGDLMVARYDNNWRMWYSNHNSGSNASTGHVMTIWGPPIQVGDDNTTSEYYEYDVRILDASGSGHGNDTRTNNPASLDGDGFGFGWMRIKVSTRISKRPYKYKWTPTSPNWYVLYDSNSTTTTYTRLGGILFARYIGD